MPGLEGLKRPWRAVRRAVLHLREIQGDRARGIETRVPRFNTPANAVRSPYEPVHYRSLAIIDQRTPVAADEVFYDLGCGKGRVLCHFASRPIRKAVGVEYDPALAAIATANVERLAGRQAETSVRVGDAGAQDYSDATLVFMFNPFGADTMRSVLRRLEGRSGLRIVYAGPVQRAVFEEFPALRIVDSFTVPYDLGTMDVVIWRHD